MKSRDPFDTKTPIKYRILLKISRLRRRLWPPNAICNNGDCGYRGRRAGKRIWCPACYEDGGGELILDDHESAGN